MKRLPACALSKQFKLLIYGNNGHIIGFYIFMQVNILLLAHGVTIRPEFLSICIDV